MTPLCRAASKGHARVALTLLEHGADVGARSKSGFSPLHLAASFCQADVADVLLFAGADPNVRHLDFQVTPLHGAALRGCREIIVKLLGRNADVNSRDKAGRTALHYACSQNHVQAAQTLLSHGAKIGAADDKGNTPLHVAAGGYVKVLDQPKTEKVGNATQTTYTQVHLECEDVVKLLLEKGAPVNAKNHAGRTPLAVAEHPTDVFAQPNHRTAELLKKHGAK